MTNSENPDQTAHHCYIFTVYNTLQILQSILREKYFDIVSEG